MEKPYVISAELDLANTNTEMIIKSDKLDGFREDLDTDLRSMGKNTVWVESRVIQNGLNKTIAATELPVVSLDDRYVTAADMYLGISRGVDRQLNDVGYVPRVDYPSFEEQLGRVTVLGREIVLVDDVMFSGEMITWLADRLAIRGVRLGGIACGIAIKEGMEKVAAQNIDVIAVCSFDDVEDEICERDFAVAPGSGRRVADASANALYFDPINGRPARWASIAPESVEDFARQSYKRSANLIRPEVEMADIGNFYGWANGNAVELLRSKQ